MTDDEDYFRIGDGSEVFKVREVDLAALFAGGRVSEAEGALTLRSPFRVGTVFRSHHPKR